MKAGRMVLADKGKLVTNEKILPMMSAYRGLWDEVDGQ
jgi:hypothetical protein